MNVHNRTTSLATQRQSADLFLSFEWRCFVYSRCRELSFATCFNTTPNNLWVEFKVALTPEINQYPLPLKNRFTDDKVQSSILISLPTYK